MQNEVGHVLTHVRTAKCLSNSDMSNSHALNIAGEEPKAELDLA